MTDRYTALAEAMPQLVWIASEDGTVTYYNGRSSNYDGIVANPDGTWLWSPAVHPDDSEVTANAWSGAVASVTAYECEHRLRMADGTYRWHLSRALPVRSGVDRRLMWFGTATDIDSQKQVEQALRESESRLRAVFSAIDQGYCLCELVTEDDGAVVDYRFLETNPLFEEMTGLVAATGRTAYELVPDLEPHWLDTYAQVALGGEPMRFEQGSEAMGRWFDVFATPVEPLGRFALVFSDVTTRRAAEVALRTQQEEDRRVSVRLQRALLPGDPVSHPRLDLATRYMPAAGALEVGGDWFETYEITDGRVGLTVGDVVGHNIEAAAAMGQLRAGLLALSAKVTGPAELLVDLDAFACRHSITDFATACCAFVDPESGEVSYSSAGHPPILMVPPEGDPVWLEGASSLPLGIDSLVERKEASLILERGSLLFAYSDGLVERRGRRLEEGLGALFDLLSSIRHLGADDLCREVVAGMADPAGYEDDTVVVCLRFAP